MHRRSVAVAIAAALAGGCSGADEPRAPTLRPAPEPALARAPVAAGEVLVRGEASPRTHGPYALRGTYVARFQQYAPEDPSLDFSTQTPFTAVLDERPEGRQGRTIRLFSSARRSGRRTVRATGRLYVDVAFGDFPYVLRLTPVDR